VEQSPGHSLDQVERIGNLKKEVAATGKKTANAPVRHHYLPVFYLQQWCDVAGKIVRYYRPNREVVASPIAPENTGYEPHLYALDGYPAEQRQWIEKHFMGPAVDDPASKALRVLLASNLPMLAPEMRVDWTRFLMSLTLRDPESVAKTNADMRSALMAQLTKNQEWFEARIASGDQRTFVEWVKTNIPAMLESSGTLHLPDFIDNADIGTAMIKMSWLRSILAAAGSAF